MTIVIICAKTGAHLRNASRSEAQAYLDGNIRTGARRDACWNEPVRLTETETATEYNGPGQRYDGLCLAN